MSTAEIIRILKRNGHPEHLTGMARYGMSIDRRLGISIPFLRALAKTVGRDHALALSLWRTRFAEARILASMIDDPHRVTARQMEQWARDFDSWDVCDQVCMNLFAAAPPAKKKIRDWARNDEEFVKRAAFAMIACIAWHDTTASDRTFSRFFPILKREAEDQRNYVRKAVSWALRTIGKRNRTLHRAAVRLAHDIARSRSGGSAWVAADVLRELEGAAVLARLAKTRKHA